MYILLTFLLFFTVFFFSWIWIGGWISFAAYILAPVIQIIQIYNKKSTKGLSKITFYLLIIANIAFILSELVFRPTGAAGSAVSPIILKSFTLFSLYAVILLQFRIYNGKIF